MKVSKRQLKRIIREEKAKLSKRGMRRMRETAGDMGLDMVKADMANLRQAITTNFNNEEKYDVGGDPGMAGMYRQDAEALTFIHDQAMKELDIGAERGSSTLTDAIANLDTAAREQIPDKLYYWITG